jgi:hypothetical protein
MSFSAQHKVLPPNYGVPLRFACAVRATEAPTFQLLTILFPRAPFQVEREPYPLPIPTVLQQSNSCAAAPGSRPLSRIAASFNMSATWLSKRGMFALLGAAALVFLLAGHYTYTNSMDGKLRPLRKRTKG